MFDVQTSLSSLDDGRSVIGSAPIENVIDNDFSLPAYVWRQRFSKKEWVLFEYLDFEFRYFDGQIACTNCGGLIRSSTFLLALLLWYERKKYFNYSLFAKCLNKNWR